MFNQLTALRLGQAFPIPTAADIEAALDRKRYVPIGPSQEKSVGFSPPRCGEHDPLVEAIGGHYIMRLQIETKSVPRHTITEKTDERCKALEESTGRKPGKKERRDIADDVLLSLLPTAFPKLHAVTLWINPERRTLCLNTASQGKIDTVVSELCNTFTDFQITYLNTTISPQAAMTQWLLADTHDEWPANLSIERECVLKSTGDDGATVKFSKHHLATDEVKKHIREGKLPTSLALSWDGKVAFVLGETLQLKKLQFLDGIMNDSGSDKNEDRFDADVALSTGLLAPLLDDMVQALGGEMQLVTPDEKR